MYFTIQVYDCTHCPHADHDREQCLEVLNQDGIVSQLEQRAHQAYQENCMELCDSCPRVQ